MGKLLDKKVNPKHILGMHDLSRPDILSILALAKKFKNTPKAPTQAFSHKTVVNLFFEPSTRTRSSFEIATKRLGASSINITSSSSSTIKGETLIDTAKNLEAMNPDVIIIRHFSSGAPYVLSQVLKTPIINAGDGFHEHPTQALLDMMTIEEAKGKISGLTVLIVGDIAHSRVARSNIYGLQKMGAKIIVCGPPTLIPPDIQKLHVGVSHSLKEVVSKADVIMMLRIQEERQDRIQFPSKREYIKYFGLTLDTLKQAKKDVIIMHPGPLNRGVEIASEVADGPYSVILNQVTNGVVVRMALLSMLMKAGKIE